jgi:hypothetical protein
VSRAALGALPLVAALLDGPRAVRQPGATTDAPPAPAAVATSATLVAEGDALYARRAEGAQGGTAAPGPVERALEAYRRAAAADAASVLARCRLIRALFFRASFCPADAGLRRRLFDEARRAAEQMLQPLEARTRGMTRAARLAWLRQAPGSAEAFFWAAVAWGEWAQARGKLQAARQGAGGRIRDLAQTVIELDPALEQGGGHRVLGRLHDQAPRVPLLTGWVSRRVALESLDQALARGPDNTVNLLFLAEAILEHAPERKQEARLLLERLAAAAPRPEYAVEDARYAELARERLRALR